jgi:hypothetical protein
MRWEIHEISIYEMINAYKILVITPERRSFRRIATDGRIILK